MPAQTIQTTAPTWSTTFAADADYTWSVSADGYTTPVHSTKVIMQRIASRKSWIPQKKGITQRS